MRTVKPKAFPEEPLVIDPSVLAAFVRAARTQSNFTLENAAIATGVAKSTMQSIETHPDNVAFATVLRVARELGVSLVAIPAEQREVVRKLIKNLNRPQPGRDKLL